MLEKLCSTESSKYHENVRDCFFCEAFEFQILGAMDKLAYGQIFSIGSYAQIFLLKNHGIRNTQFFDDHGIRKTQVNDLRTTDVYS